MVCFYLFTYDVSNDGLFNLHCSVWNHGTSSKEGKWKEDTLATFTWKESEISTLLLPEDGCSRSTETFIAT
jgi:hypothetical protein